MTPPTNHSGDVGRVIVLDVVGLQPDHINAGLAPQIAGLCEERTGSLRPPFPAVTIPSQTTLATGQPPSAHGDVANGEYDRQQDTVGFWERDRENRTRLWEAVSDTTELTTGVLFFQHLIGTSADVAVTPSPIEDEDNNMIEMNCWTNPDGFYDDLRGEYGHFPLHNYWGPTANEQSSEWILSAAREAIERYDPDLLWVYIPHLDYDAQRYGPDAEQAHAAVEVVDELVGEFLEWLRARKRWPETVVNVVSEYGFHTVERPVFPNRVLREAGLLSVQDDLQGGKDVDIADSDAFSMVDHQVAHVYVEDDKTHTKELLASVEGVESVLGEKSKAEYGIDHPNSGELVLVAEPDAWFQYYWWFDDSNASYYATEMDIHAKPGFDPCELFIGEEGLASLDPKKVRGSHGRVDQPGIYGLGGPAAPKADIGEIDARTVAPTIADLLDVRDALPMEFERGSLFESATND